jgi:OFA family oxalate/formate antiporter-like MFS transporter
MKKYVSLATAIVTMVCLGGLYSWSIYIAPLQAQYGLSTAQAQWVFGVTIAVFTLTMVGAGRFQHMYGPRRLVLSGAGLFAVGYWLGAWSNGRFWLLMIGIGMLSGAGIGMAYLAALSTPVQWFPRQRGLITGIAAAGFGGGAVVCSRLVDMLLAADMPLAKVFATVGSSYGLVLACAALGFVLPSERKGPAQQKTPSLQFGHILQDRLLWMLCAGMFAGTFAGLLVVGNLKSLGLAAGASESAATLGISLFAVGNALGRVLWGRVADAIPGRRVLAGALIALTVSVILLLPGAGHNGIFAVLALLIGMNFGANFVLYAAEVLRVYGARQFGQIYPLVFLFYGVAGIFGPLLGGWLFDSTRSYAGAILLAAILCAGGAGLLLLSVKRSFVQRARPEFS